MMTMDQIAEQLNVSKPLVYGLVRFLEEIGTLKAVGRAQPNGKAGKPATLYVLTETAGLDLAVALTPWFNAQKAKETTVVLQTSNAA